MENKNLENISERKHEITEFCVKNRVLVDTDMLNFMAVYMVNNWKAYVFMKKRQGIRIITKQEFRKRLK